MSDITKDGMHKQRVIVTLLTLYKNFVLSEDKSWRFLILLACSITSNTSKRCEKGLLRASFEQKFI